MTAMVSSATALAETPQPLFSTRTAWYPGSLPAISDDGSKTLSVTIARHRGTTAQDLVANMVDTRTGHRRRLGVLGLNELPSFDPITTNVLYTGHDGRRMVLQRGSDARVLRSWDGFHALAVGGRSAFAFVSRRRSGSRSPLSSLGVLNLTTRAFTRLPPSHARALKHPGFVSMAKMSDDGRFVAFFYVHSVDWRFWVIVDRSQRTYRFFPDSGLALSMSRTGRTIAVGTDHNNTYSIYDPVTEHGTALPSYNNGSGAGGTLNAAGTSMSTTCGSRMYVHSLQTGTWTVLPMMHVQWSALSGDATTALFATQNTVFSTSLAAAQPLGIDTPSECIDPAELAVAGQGSSWFDTQNVLDGRSDCQPPRGSSGGCDPQVARPNS
jgi:hypothetical protein